MGRRQTRTNNRAGHSGNRGRPGGRKPNGTRTDNRTNIQEGGRMKRWETAEDIPMDEEDEFFAARDKILLDSTARARARAGPAPGDDDEFDEDDEVFGLDGVGESSEEDYDDDDMEEDRDNQPEPRSKTKAKPKKQVAAQPEDSDASTDSEAELSRWGKSRSAYYADNSRVMDEDDEEARKMEEREARRLQLKMITEIGENDWGYNDVHDIEVAISQSALPAVPELPMDKASLMRHMEKYDPLSLALAREWEDIAYQVIETSAAVKQVEEESPDDPALGLMHLHHQTLLSYATTLAFYLHLQSTPTNYDPPLNSSETSSLTPKEAKRLRTEAIGRLLTLKQSLATLEDLGFAADEEEDFDESDEEILTDEGEGEEGEESPEEDISPYGLKPGEKVSLVSGGVPQLQNLGEPWKQDKIAGWMDSTSPSEPKNPKKKKKKTGSDLGSLEEGELEALMQDALDLAPPAETSPPKKKKKLDYSETSETSKKKKSDIPKPVFDLVEPEFTVAKSKAKQDSALGVDVDLEALGDPTQLSHTDASDKAGRRKSLRFHTSKIESTSNRRSTARSGMGGDDDLPYRERRKEQNRRGLGEGGDDLEMGEDGDGDTGMDADSASIGKRNRTASEPLGDDEGSEGEDGYYELVRTAKKQRKEEQKAEYEAMRAAERIDPDEESSEGPRSLTRAILKNRGMTANRSPKNKAARNPRVKKKMQYVKAQKKLRSRQAVFKGGAEVAAAREGRYEGEKSGISGRVVKSIKL
ncbi:unnamed protein product [Rhizoctonia solani]|uniref:Sas10 C-terminal domain-containing protein n=1 Tax=Rhizoctonia solani TaxID=456999 RepID=A0A8H2WSU0_9AGAM|nr:unnamed protein product [Rhizoctonia solani]